MNKPHAQKKRVLWSRLALVVLLGCLLTGCGGGSGAGPGEAGGGMAADEGKPIKGDRATLLVYGMACPLCANNIDKELLTVPGVSKAEVDMGNGTVRLEFSGAVRPTPKQLAEAVDHAGFTYKGITVP
jgi:copper chaperone CopZ